MHKKIIALILATLLPLNCIAQATYDILKVDSITRIIQNGNIIFTNNITMTNLTMTGPIDLNGGSIGAFQGLTVDSTGATMIGTNVFNYMTTAHMTHSNAMLQIYDGRVSTGNDTNFHNAHLNMGTKQPVTNGAVAQIQFFNGILPDYSQRLAMITVRCDGDTNLGHMAFLTRRSTSINPLDAMRIDSEGHVGIGTTAPIAPLHISASDGSGAAINSKIDDYGYSGSSYPGTIVLAGTNIPILNMCAAGPSTIKRAMMWFKKSAGTLASPTVSIVNDYIGSIYASAYDGYKYLPVGDISFLVEEAPSSNSVPSKIQFGTGTNTVSPRMTIDHDGNVNHFGNTISNATYIGNGGGLTNVNGGMLTNDTTYTLSAANTHAANQAIILSIPANLGTHTATITFPAGTYTSSPTDPLFFSYFYNGYMVITGPTVSNAVHTNQTAIILGTNIIGSQVQFCFVRVTAPIIVQNIKFHLNTTNVNYSQHIQTESCNMNNMIQYCSFFGRANNGLQLNLDRATKMRVYASYFSLGYAAIYAQYGASVYVDGCIKGTAATYGYYATYGGMIQRGDTNILGTTDNVVWAGGQVITSAGLIHP